MFAAVLAAVGLGRSHEQRERIFAEARAPEKALREQLLRQDGGRLSVASRARLEREMRSASRRLFTTMNLAANMGTELAFSGPQARSVGRGAQQCTLR